MARTLYASPADIDWRQSRQRMILSGAAASTSRKPMGKESRVGLLMREERGDLIIRPQWQQVQQHQRPGYERGDANHRNAALQGRVEHKK
jgi:hypothetical protein